jgi:sugar phosphate isomerase/epimerase
MKLGLINSAWVQTQKDTAWGIWKTKELGFDTIDIFADPLEMSDIERRLIKFECDRAGLPIVSIACVALGLSDFNPSVQQFHRQRVEAYLDLAREYQARNVLLVLGEYLWQREVIAPEDQWRTAVENVRRLGEYAADLGLEIALEMEPFRESLLNTVPEMARFLAEVDRPAVQANVDISHMVLAGQAPESLEQLRGRIAHVHISDCDGRKHGDLPPGRGVVSFPPYLDALSRMGLGERTIAIELEYSPEPERIVEWVEEARDQTAALMRQAGLRP